MRLNAGRKDHHVDGRVSGPKWDPALDLLQAGGAFPDSGDGNGAVLRLAPLAIFAGADADTFEALAERQSRATHGGIVSLDVCRLFAAQLADALAGAGKAEALRPRAMARCWRVLFINAGEWRGAPASAITTSGEAADTLAAGLWAVAETTGFREAVRAATSFGGNATGAAAVAGQLAGALYGASAIPAKWLGALLERDRIEILAGDLFDVRLSAASA